MMMIIANVIGCEYEEINNHFFNLMHDGFRGIPKWGFKPLFVIKH